MTRVPAARIRSDEESLVVAVDNLSHDSEECRASGWIDEIAPGLAGDVQPVEVALLAESGLLGLSVDHDRPFLLQRLGYLDTRVPMRSLVHEQVVDEVRLVARIAGIVASRSMRSTGK